jgi:hypothetical protein
VGVRVVLVVVVVVIVIVIVMVVIVIVMVVIVIVMVVIVIVMAVVVAVVGLAGHDCSLCNSTFFFVLTRECEGARFETRMTRDHSIGPGADLRATPVDIQPPGRRWSVCLT